MTSSEKLDIAVRSLSVFDCVKTDEGANALMKMLREQDTETRAELWARYYNALAKAGCEDDSVGYFRRLVVSSDNVFGRRIAAGESAESLKKEVGRELNIINKLASLTPADFEKSCGETVKAFAAWKKGGSKIPDADELEAVIRKDGFGALSQSVAYRFDGEKLLPIEGISPIRLSDLKRCDDCKSAVVDNTLGFLEGLPANNVLLYGDRGSGKSSTVHAVLNEFKDRGLRLVELNKAEIKNFPRLFETVKSFKIFKFVIFIDDLTFIEGADDFAELKAALEGSVFRPENALIYATTNRRHLVRESFDKRENDVHINDTLQEEASLSDRFGLVVTFLSPDKSEFCEILKDILSDRNMQLNSDELCLLAERYALKKGGRSGRAAKQLADMIESRLKRGLSLEDLF